MPVPPSRRFLVAALLHLATASGLATWAEVAGRLADAWDATLWLLLVGFVACTTTGFGVHLFSQVSRRPSQAPGVLTGVLVALESSVLLGTLSLLDVLSTWSPTLFGIAALLLLAAEAAVLAGFLDLLRARPLSSGASASRPGDAITVPLFVSAWIFSTASAGLFFLSALAAGPGFGWWVAAVHLLVLGHAALLVGAVSVRLVPRSVGADPPRRLVTVLATLGISGGFLVPLGMLVTPPALAWPLVLFALPEAGFAIALVGTLVVLAVRSTTPRPQLALHIGGIAFFLVGGGIGLGMAATSDYGALVAHAWVNVVGFLGLTILLMWFGMIAPFQRISHSWTRRMLWILAGLWIVSVGLEASAVVLSLPRASLIAAAGSGLLLIAALLWAIGTVPVLFPQLPPLPGARSNQVGRSDPAGSRR